MILNCCTGFPPVLQHCREAPLPFCPLPAPLYLGPAYSQEFRARMEVWGLMRIAFSAARVALSRSGINKIAMRSFAGIGREMRNQPLACSKFEPDLTQLPLPA